MHKLTHLLKTHPLKSFTAFIILFFLWCNISFPDPDLSKPENKIKYGELTHDEALVTSGYDSLCNQYPDSLDIHYQHIISHYSVARFTRNGLPLEREDGKIEDYYWAMTHSHDATLRDIGYYGLGLCYAMEDEYQKAISNYDSVHNKKMKYLSNSLGYAYLVEGDNKLARILFKHEIENKGNLEAAYFNLFNLYYKTKNYSAYAKLLETDAAYKYCNPKQLADFYFLTHDPIHYPVTLIRNLASRVNFYGFMGAFLILLMWLIYLRFVDVFEPERWLVVIVVAMGGMLGALFVFPISDFTALVLGVELNRRFFHDLFYYVLNVGAVEELVKIIPLLILLRYTKLVKEPIDFIIYGCVSALGFAFAENLLYFDASSLYIIHIRGFMSVVGHMFITSIIAYGLMVATVKRKINIFLMFLLCYVVAAIVHGLFDFFLLARGSFLISYMILLYGFYLMGIFLNNALNQTSSAGKRGALNVKALSVYLICGLSSIYAFEYFVLAIKFGHSYANDKWFSSAVLGIFILIILSRRMSNFEIIPGYWEPFSGTLPFKRPGMSEWVDKRIEVSAFHEGSDIASVLPATGVVVKRLVIRRRTDSVLVKMDIPIDVLRLYERLDLRPVRSDYVIVRCKPRQLRPELGTAQPYYLILISETVSEPETAVFETPDMFFVDWVLLRTAIDILPVTEVPPVAEPLGDEMLPTL